MVNVFPQVGHPPVQGMKKGLPVYVMHQRVHAMKQRRIDVPRDIMAVHPVICLAVPNVHRIMALQVPVPPAVRPYHRVVYHPVRDIRFQMTLAVAPQ